MSICLTWFPIDVLGEPNIYQNLVCFTRIGEDCGGCLTCEELVGVSHRKNYMQPCVTASNKK